jgi:hypothetical protein
MDHAMTIGTDHGQLSDASESRCLRGSKLMKMMYLQGSKTKAIKDG